MAQGEALLYGPWDLAHLAGRKECAPVGAGHKEPNGALCKAAGPPQQGHTANTEQEAHGAGQASGIDAVLRVVEGPHTTHSHRQSFSNVLAANFALPNKQP